MSERRWCSWSSNRLPHTAHGTCEGFMPELAESCQRIMDRQAAETTPPQGGDGS